MKKCPLLLLTILFAVIFSIHANAQISGASSVCVGASTTLSGTPAGGTWGSSNTAVAVVGITSGIVHGVSSGVVTISYTEGMVTSTVVMTVNTTPGAGTISGASDVCSGANITLTDGVPGGTWAASNAHATVTGGIVTGVSAGVDTIGYTVTNACGSATATKAVTVNGLPSAGAITGASSVCVGAAISLSVSGTGGVWSSSNASATVSGGVVTGVSAGVDTIMYTVTNSCASDVASTVVTIDPLPSAGSIVGSSLVCTGATITLTDAVPGGIWSSSNGNASVLGGVVTGVTTGMDTISYTVTSACGTAVATAEITISSVPSPGMLAGPADVCAGASITLTASVSGGVWAAANTNATVTGGVVTGMFAGVDTIDYTVSNVCGSATVSATVTVNPMPFAGSISGAGAVCSGSMVTLTDGVAGGVWSSSDLSIATVSSTGDVAGLMAGGADISYTVTNSCGTDFTMVSISVDEPAAPIAGPTVVCQLSIITLTDATPGGTWTSSAPLTAFVFGGTVLGGLVPGIATITYAVTNACGTTEATLDVAVINCVLAEPGIAEVKEELILVPNPNNGIFALTLASASSEDVHISITNVLGERVKELTTATNKTTEVRTDLPAGIYFVSAWAAGKQYTARVIVQ